MADAVMLKPGESTTGVVGGYTITITAPESTPTTPTTGGGRLVVGTTTDPAQYAARLPLYPDSRQCRVFWPPKAGGPDWGDKRIRKIHDVAPDAMPAFAFKDWASDLRTRLAVHNWLDGMPDWALQSPTPVDLAHLHEADAKGFAAAEWKRRQEVLAVWLAEHPNGGRVRLTPTQTSQWTVAKSRPGNPKGDGDVTKYYTGVGTPAIDMYANSWEDTYPDPVKFLAPLRALADLSGTAPAVPELGAARLPFDTTGTARADWLEAVAALMSGLASSVCYWDDLGTGGTDLRLTQDPAVVTPEVEAWRRVIADHGLAA